MSQAPDYFSDILAPGEVVLAHLGGAGPVVERPNGPERVWYQLGVTGARVLVVKLVQSAMTGTYAPQARLAVGKEFVAIRRFPRTSASPAHLEIRGAGDPITIVDIDDKTVFPFVEPFLAAWGGQVEGAGVVVPREREPDDYHPPSVENTKLLYAVIAILAILWACCGCAGLGLAIRQLV